MLSPVPNSRRTLAAQALKLSRAGARDDEIGLLRHAVLEYSGALEHEAARFPCNVPDDPLEAPKLPTATTTQSATIRDFIFTGQ
jgi:hypothetical protein